MARCGRARARPTRRRRLDLLRHGVYKSTDQGAHWTNVGLRESASIGRIAIDPSNPDKVFAAAAGNVSRPAAQRGLYRTVDGGKSWQLVLAPTTPTTGAIDVAINPANPQIVYAALWGHTRNNGARVYGGVGSCLFRSKDGGDTWERLQNIVDPLWPGQRLLLLRRRRRQPPRRART